MAGVCSALAILFPAATAEVLFGGEATSGLVAATAALLLATAVFYVAFGYFRGRLRIVAANSLQVLASGLVPRDPAPRGARARRSATWSR